MIPFLAHDVWKACETLTEWSRNFDRLLSPTEQKRYAEDFRRLGVFVREVSLPISAREMDKLMNYMEGYTEDSSAVEDVSVQRDLHTKYCVEVTHRLEHVSSTIHSELESKAFFYMPPEQKIYYDKPELFGSAFTQKFPQLQFDLVESANCYALGRGTACVFHLMRMMEVGVRSFGNKLGVQLTDTKNWQHILDEANRAIKLLPAKRPDAVSLNQVAANLYSVKVAWRNEVMHPNDTYTLEEAENLIRQVKLFLTNLADML